jgi:hypothetical protein
VGVKKSVTQQQIDDATAGITGYPLFSTGALKTTGYTLQVGEIARFNHDGMGTWNFTMPASPSHGDQTGLRHVGAVGGSTGGVCLDGNGKSFRYEMDPGNPFTEVLIGMFAADSTLIFQYDDERGFWEPISHNFAGGSSMSHMANWNADCLGP